MRLTGDRHSRAGFTLIEMMVVILIMSVLMTIAVPNWMKARNTARTRSCVSNMRHIESAKEQYATETAMSCGDAVAMADIVPAYVRQTPTCPAGGDYTPEPVGTNPKCPHAADGHVLE